MYPAALCVIATMMVQMCYTSPVPEPGSHYHRIKILVPYKVHSVHHHHVKHIPVIKEVPVFKEVPVIKEVPIVKPVPVLKTVPVPIVEHVPYEKKVYVPVPIKEHSYLHDWH